ncbi:Uncharacterised protein [Segatella copri]|nr:Uncharacterised protein [Segatella copri]
MKSRGCSIKNEVDDVKAAFVFVKSLAGFLIFLDAFLRAFMYLFYS